MLQDWNPKSRLNVWTKLECGVSALLLCLLPLLLCRIVSALGIGVLANKVNIGWSTLVPNPNLSQVRTRRELRTRLYCRAKLALVRLVSCECSESRCQCILLHKPYDFMLYHVFEFE